jgi:hypothetical protein
MAVDQVDRELAQLQEAVPCRRCTHGYPAHRDAGGPCGEVINDRFPCLCPGMQWVDPDGPSVGSYSDPPG